MITDKYVFFWGSIFSQWAPSPFIIDGVEYNCTEQYMMSKKALMFDDFDAHIEIMLEKQPAIQKAIGKTVRGFDKTKWETYCIDIVTDANYAKFTQNPKMKAELLASGDREIVEASPEDRIWGIGLHESNPDVLDKNKWKGTNWLGICIMRVRDRIRKEIEDSKPQELKDAIKYVRDCENDIGFLGSPKYYEQKEIIKKYEENND